jgi:uncharacterized protein with HEPN domain
MTNRLPKHLFDTWAAAGLAREFCAGVELPHYEASALLRSAVERQLEILGEAAPRCLDAEPALKERVPGLPLAMAQRNRIIHGYDWVENKILFDTVPRDLPVLIAALDRELEAYPTPGGSA